MHIHNGDSTAETARKTDLPGEHLAWREALVCGPVPAGLSEDDFRRTRAGYLAEAYELNVQDCDAQLREQGEVLARFSDHEEIVLWFEHDLFCQVHLIYLLNWFAQREAGQTRLSLISIGEFPGIEDFRGLGQLNETQLASLFPHRRELTDSQLKLGRKAWQAYSSPDPREIESLLKSDPASLPFLKNALTKHLQRFPSTLNGLGRIENVGLQLIAAGHTVFMSLFPAFGKAEPTYGYGDAQFRLEMKRLAEASNPLIRMRDEDRTTVGEASQMLQTSFHITERGQAVLRGDEDFIRANEINLWLGGVHLEGEGAAWRWSDDRGKLIAK